MGKEEGSDIGFIILVEGDVVEEINFFLLIFGVLSWEFCNWREGVY